MANPKKFRFVSTGLIHAPGMIRWLQNVYTTSPAWAKRMFTEGWPTVPADVADAILSGTADLRPDGPEAITYHPSPEA